MEFLPVTSQLYLHTVPPEREGIPSFPPFQLRRACDKEEKGQRDISTMSLEEKENMDKLDFFNC